MSSHEECAGGTEPRRAFLRPPTDTRGPGGPATITRRRLARLALLALAALLVPAGAAAQVTHQKLDNGLTVIVRENPVAPVVAVALLVRMGTRWEQPATAGISNFVHAVMVKGTAKRGGSELAEAVAALGGKISATGEVDYSELRGTALARFWRELLGLTAELALEPEGRGD